MAQKSLTAGLLPPLAERMRPRSFSDFFGQKKIVGEGALLRKLVEADQLSSLVFWGPPGVGKTTLAHIIGRETGAQVFHLSAVNSGKKDLQKIVAAAEERQALGQRTLLFIDEIHRWNKAQQDALLPHVERGTIILIGATTENPSFELNRALLSRSRVFILESLSEVEIVSLLTSALSDAERGLGKSTVTAPIPVLETLAGMAGGDARVALNALELAVQSSTPGSELTVLDIKEALQRTNVVFDNKGEEFYNLISALHKSMRGSDADASLYWLARMVEGGADPLYIARRLVRFASEDVGMANAEALIQANAVYDACHKLGYPECSVHLAQAVVYLAKSKKSVAIYKGYKQAAVDARETSHVGVPLHLRNAPTKFMKDIGYGKDYIYNPDVDGEVLQEYFPEELRGKSYL